MNKTQNLINHIFFVLDASSSIEYARLTRPLINVFNKQIENHRNESKRTGQEARISIYTFADKVQCKLFDVNASQVANIETYYSVYGNTALIDGIMQAVKDAKTISQLHGDHSFLFVTLTDGENNKSMNTAITLRDELDSLPENFTVSILVPNQNGVYHAKNCGIPAGNISVWETSIKGAYEAADRVAESTSSYYTARSVGVRGTKNFFTPAVQNLNTRTVQTQLDELHPSQYQLFPVFRKQAIKEFVEKRTGQVYRPGSCYYSLTKAETIQSYKQLIIQEKSTGKAYTGVNARKLLQLPDYDVKVNPASHPRYDIFAQSTSVNRNLLPGTQIIILN